MTRDGRRAFLLLALRRLLVQPLRELLAGGEQLLVPALHRLDVGAG